MAEAETIEERISVILDLLTVLKDPIDSISKLQWKPTDGFWTLILRSVLVRQCEALLAITDLVKSDRAHLCVPLLRPAVEEYLWVKFLQTLTVDDREQFLVSKTVVENFATLDAQWEDAGTHVMNGLGFPTSYRNGMRKASDEGITKLRELATRLNWSIKDKKKWIPSTWFVAKQTGNEVMYSVIYHATSRTVHFTVAELLRRAWGDSNGVNISSQQMGRYWSAFSLYWGTHILLQTLFELINDFDRLGIDVEFDDKLKDVVENFLKWGKMPIITSEELNLRASQKW